VSAVLASTLLKVGVYGLMRFAVPLFPEAARGFAPAVMSFAVVGILYGAIAAATERDMLRMLSFVNLSYMGLVILGVFSFQSAGVKGAVFLMLAHGLFMGAMLLAAGMIFERQRTYRIEEWRGLRRFLPLSVILFLVVSLASAGVPGLSGFVGLFHILKGSFEVAPIHSVSSALGVGLVAVTLIRVCGKTLTGILARGPANEASDLGRREIFVLSLLVLLIVWMGAAPSGFLRTVEPSIELFLSRSAVGTAVAE